MELLKDRIATFFFFVHVISLCKHFLSVGDKSRDMSLSQLLDLSLPYAEISSDGKVCVAKAEGSGGILNISTCAQQLLYEVGDPGAYVTPDVVSCMSVFKHLLWSTGEK